MEWKAPDLNLPSLSLRSEDRLVRSTENLSTLKLRIRACMVIPICVIDATMRAYQNIHMQLYLLIS